MIDEIMRLLMLSIGGWIAMTCIGRQASMGWKTHKRGWQIVYGLLTLWAVGNVFQVLDGKDHFNALIGLVATALWLYESRNRWKDGVPKWMERDVDSTTPGVAPE